MAPLTSIRTSNGKLEIVNQLLLPHTVEFLEINTVAAAHDAIKTMKVFVLMFKTTPASLTAKLDSRSTSNSVPCVTLRILSPFRGIGDLPIA
jgi:methylthioribose-1-phosphate isomerase